MAIAPNGLRTPRPPCDQPSTPLAWLEHNPSAPSSPLSPPDHHRGWVVTQPRDPAPRLHSWPRPVEDLTPIRAEHFRGRREYGAIVTSKRWAPYSRLPRKCSALIGVRSSTGVS